MAMTLYRASHLLNQILPSRPATRILLLLLLLVVLTTSTYNVQTSTSLIDVSKGPAKGPRRLLSEDSSPPSIRAKGLLKNYAPGPIRNLKRRETICQFCEHLKMAVEDKVHNESDKGGRQTLYGGDALELWDRYCDGKEGTECREGHGVIVAQSWV